MGMRETLDERRDTRREGEPRPPLCVSVEEAARLLGIGRNLAYELCQQGRIPSLKLGKRTVVPLARLEEFVLTASS